VPLPEASGQTCPLAEEVFGSAQRSRRLISAASVRLCTASFRSRFVTWTLTVLDLQDRPDVAARVSRRQDLNEWLARSPLIEIVFDDEELRTASAQRNTAT
jgi:hypothetical protein